MSAPATTTVTDTIYQPDGSLANGSLLISTTETFVSADGFTILQGFSINVPVVKGVFNVDLVPNADSSPASKYRVKYDVTQGYFSEYWEVPSSENAVGLEGVRAT